VKEKIEALAKAWDDLARTHGFPNDYNGCPTALAHQATESIETLLRDHLVGTGDKRLFGLMHLLGQAALSMEHELWPEYRASIDEEVRKALDELAMPFNGSTGK